MRPAESEYVMNYYHSLLGHKVECIHHKSFHNYDHFDNSPLIIGGRYIGHPLHGKKKNQLLQDKKGKALQIKSKIYRHQGRSHRLKVEEANSIMI